MSPPPGCGWGGRTREVNWGGSQTTGPRICDRSEEPLPDTILLPLRTTNAILARLSFGLSKKAAVRMRITSEL